MPITFAYSLNTVSLILDNIEEVMMVLRGHTPGAVLEVPLEVLPHLLLFLRSSTLSVEVGGAMATNETVFTASDSHGSSIACHVSLVATGRPVTPTRELNLTSRPGDARSLALVRAYRHLSLERIVEAHAVGHVLILGVGVLAGQLVLLGLLLEQHQARVVRPLNDASEVHGVVDLVLGLQHLFEAEVVVALLQGVERDVLVVPVEDLLGLARARRGGRRLGKHRLVRAGVSRLRRVLCLQRHLGGRQTKALLEIRLVVAVSHFYYNPTFEAISKNFKSHSPAMPFSIPFLSLSREIALLLLY